MQYYEHLIATNSDYQYVDVFADRGITGTTQSRLEENIKTLSGDGELRLTILSAFAQEESKNISDNQKWAIRKKFQRGELQINTTRFLGYDKDVYGDLIINQKEAEIVERIFTEYLSGKGLMLIVKGLNADEIPNLSEGKWHTSSISSILKNEKYKGDAHLQKYFTPDKLMNKSVKNNDQIDSYYIKENHSPIVSKDIWDRVQEESVKRGKAKGSLLEL